MGNANVIFVLDGIEVKIQCSKDDKMKEICEKYATKIEADVNSLIFLYGGGQLNLDLCFKEQASSIDNDKDEMTVLVYKKETEGFICPKCGEKIDLNTKNIDEIILSNNNIIDALTGAKIQIENIIKNSSVNSINIQLKNINVILNTINEDINKANIKLQNLLGNNINNNNIENKGIICNDSNINNIITNNISVNTNANEQIVDANIDNNKNEIIGVLDIKVNEINNKIALFKKYESIGIDVYVNDKKINLIKNHNKRLIDYNFPEDGTYTFKMVFKDKMNDLRDFFEDNTHIISLDVSNFNTSKVSEMSHMFHRCKNLKEIKGINRFITNKVTNMEGMFSECEELEYLDLSNLDTSNIMNMDLMFNKCLKIKEIKGINKFITSKVRSMKAMFQYCLEIIRLDLSNFDTQRVNNMSYMFNKCKKLREIRGLNKFVTNKVTNMKAIFSECISMEYLDLSNFDTSNTIDMSYMFNYCNKLKEIKGINKFITNKVTIMNAMFQLCISMEYLDLSSFDTSKLQIPDICHLCLMNVIN